MTVPGPDERDLARRAQGGDARAWAELVTAHWGRILGIHALCIEGEDGPADLAEATFERAWKGLGEFRKEGEPLSVWLAALARDTLRGRLDDDGWKATPWSQGLEILSDPPAAGALEPGTIHAGEAIEPGALEAALVGLAPGHRLAARLALADGLPAGRLAGLFGAPAAFVGSFLYGLLDRMGGLEALEHGGDEGPDQGPEEPAAPPCPPALKLALEVLEKRGDPTGSRALLIAHRACEGCRTVIFRTLRLAAGLASALAGPPRPVPADVAARLAVLAAPVAPGAPESGPVPQARRPPDRLVPIVALPHRSVRERAVGPVLAVLVLAGFLGGTWVLLKDHRVRPGRPAGEPEVAARARDASRPPTGMVGYASDPTGRKLALFAGQVLTGSPLGVTAVTLLAGPRMVLDPATAIWADSARIEVVSGRALVVAPAAGAGGLVIGAGGATLSLAGGTAAVRTGPGGETVMAVKGSGGKVVLAGGRTLELEPFQQIRIAPGGTFAISEAPPEAFVDSESAPAPAGSDTDSSRSTPLGRYAARARGPGAAGGPSASAGTLHPAPVGGETVPRLPGPDPADGKNPVMLPGGAARPGTVRGFRDAF